MAFYLTPPDPSSVHDCSIHISGAKNSLLPIMFSTLLIKEKTVIKNVPLIKDLYGSLDILDFLGIESSLENDELHLRNSGIRNKEIGEIFTNKTRYSTLLLGTLGHLFGTAKVAFPGGCRFGGKRPIDIHLDALKNFGATISESKDFVSITSVEKSETPYKLRFPSVGATLQCILFCVLGRGTFIIQNCAKEPEISDLINFLNKCGARIAGQGTGELIIQSVEELTSFTWHLIPDRIETISYAIVAALLECNITLHPVNWAHIQLPIEYLERMGVPYFYEKNTLTVLGRQVKELKPIEIETSPYPGFPTDLQALIATLCLKAKGTSQIREKVFQNRYLYIIELKKAGARITQYNQETIFIDYSVDNMKETAMLCKDIRGGMACVLAALICKGKSLIKNEDQIYRGYTNLIDNLAKLGCIIESI